jgi:TRAP-type C4-dicarboxylate transport system substrate-binding protein
MIGTRGIKTLALGASLVTGLALAMAPAAQAETFNLKIASGHPPAAHYVVLLNTFFVPEVKKRVSERTSHTVNFTELYAGSAVKVTETLEGLQSGIVDIGGMCYCFESSKMPLHGFQIWAPFGTNDPIKSLAIVEDVYKQTPELTDAFSEKFDQRLLSLAAQDPYDLQTTFPIKTLDDIKGRRIGGAGANLPWVSKAGAIPVQTTGAVVYTSLQNGVYDGTIAFVSFQLGLKLYELTEYYTKVGFGAMTWHGVQMNNKSFDRLPKDVQDIIAEVGAEFGPTSGEFVANYLVNGFKEMENQGMTVSDLDPAVRAQWANLLKDWPNEKAQASEKSGYPGVKVMNTLLSTAEKHGYTWPIRYKIDAGS